MSLRTFFVGARLRAIQFVKIARKRAPTAIQSAAIQIAFKMSQRTFFSGARLRAIQPVKIARKRAPTASLLGSF
jgi:hypothetical protein